VEIWATPPYLHNGSVPNLYQLLLPAAQRDKTFYTGSREFDPKYVGYVSTPFENGFEFRTSEVGNSNAGHEFRNAPIGNGVIGPELTDDERWAIIEYLKTL
jgi:RoxA-like, cytochrome c-like